MPTYIDCVDHPLERLELYDLLKKIKRRISFVGMGEQCNRGCSGPTNDGNQENADQDCASDAVHHQINCEDASSIHERGTHEAAELETHPPTKTPSHIVGLCRT